VEALDVLAVLSAAAMVMAVVPACVVEAVEESYAGRVT